MMLKGFLLIAFMASLCRGWILGKTIQSKNGSSEEKYSCFPWIFNPGCPFSRLVNWDVVCRTNTLGWEMCDYRSNLKPEKDPLSEGIKPPVEVQEIEFDEDSPSVLHELADIESDKDNVYSIVDQLFNGEEQVIQLSDGVLPTSTHNNNNNIAQELTEAVDASISDFSKEYNLSNESSIEFEEPSVFLPSSVSSSSSPSSSSEDPKSDEDEEYLDAIVKEIFDEPSKEEIPSPPEVFKIENLKPFIYNVSPLSHEEGMYNIIQKNEENPPEIISLKPFKHVVQVVKHQPAALKKTIQEESSSGPITTSTSIDEIIDPRVSSFLNDL